MATRDVQELLPVGSVVLLNNGQKKLMIFGICSRDKTKESDEYDYAGVPYPEGYVGPQMQFLFNHDDIAKILHQGYKDDEHLASRKLLADFLRLHGEAEKSKNRA